MATFDFFLHARQAQDVAVAGKMRKKKKAGRQAAEAMGTGRDGWYTAQTQLIQDDGVAGQPHPVSLARSWRSSERKGHARRADDGSLPPRGRTEEKGRRRSRLYRSAGSRPRTAARS